MGDAITLGLTLLVIATAEGIRRARGTPIMLQFVVFRGWRVGGSIPLGREYFLTSLCLPMFVPVVLERGSSEPTPRFPIKRLMTRLRARLRRARHELTLLRFTGVIGLAVLVIYVPFATAQFGGFGLIRSLLTLMTLALAQALWTWSLLRNLGCGGGDAARRSVTLLNPFAIGRAAEVASAGLVSGVPALTVAAVFLGRDAMLLQLRPVIYDVLQGEATSLDMQTLELLAPRSEWQSRLRDLTLKEDSAATCPRCGAGYRRGVTTCVNCLGVALLGR